MRRSGNSINVIHPQTSHCHISDLLWQLMFCICSAEVAKHWTSPLTAEKHRKIDEQLPGYGILLHKILLLQSKLINSSNTYVMHVSGIIMPCVEHMPTSPKWQWKALDCCIILCHNICFAFPACVFKQPRCSLKHRPSILQALSRPGRMMLHSCAPQWQLKHLNRTV